MAEPVAKPSTPRTGTKQALLFEMLQASDDATMADITCATSWQPHTARGAMSGAMGRKLWLVVTSAKEDVRRRAYRLGQRGEISRGAASS